MNARSLSVSIRPGTPADLAYVYDLGRRTLDASLSPLRPAPHDLVAQNFDRLVRFTLDGPHELFIAEVVGQRQGFLLALTRLPDEVTGTQQLFVAYMAVEPHARRRSLGRQLLEAAQTRAVELGLPAIALMVTEQNEAARSLYASLGFLTERRLLCKPL